MSKSIANGLSQDITVQAGQSIKFAWLGGTYTARIVAGAASLPVALATNSAADMAFGPYATPVVIRLTVSAIGRVAWDSGAELAFRPPGESFTRQDDGVSVKLTGVGPSAAFAVDGAGNSEKYSGQIASIARIPSVFSASQKQQQTDSEFYARATGSGIVAQWPTYYCGTNNGGLETPLGGAVTITASLTVPGFPAYQVKWSGQTSITTSEAYTPDCDPIPAYMLKGKKGMFRTFWDSPIGTVCENGSGVAGSGDPDGGEIYRRAASGMTDQTMSGVALTGGTSVPNLRYGPINIRSTMIEPSVLIIGTSIAQGETSSAAGTPAAPAAPGELGDKGIIARVIGATVPYIQVAQGGSQLAQFLRTGDRALRMQLAQYVTHVIIDHGRNDIIGANSSVEQILADYQTLRGLFPGKKLFLCTILPVTTGAWTLADGSDQVISTTNGFNVKQPQLNALIRAGIPGYEGYFDLCQGVCLPGNEAKWFANGTAALMTPDGTHPSTYGEQLVRTRGVIDPTRLIR